VVNQKRPTRRCNEREPADSLRDKSNVIGGWLLSLTFSLGGHTFMRAEAHLVYEAGSASPLTAKFAWKSGGEIRTAGKRARLILDQ